MISKSSKWQLGFVHNIAKCTILRFVISRFECIYHRQALFDISDAGLPMIWGYNWFMEVMEVDDINPGWCNWAEAIWWNHWRWQLQTRGFPDIKNWGGSKKKGWCQRYKSLFAPTGKNEKILPIFIVKKGNNFMIFFS